MLHRVAQVLLLSSALTVHGQNGGKKKKFFEGLADNLADNFAEDSKFTTCVSQAGGDQREAAEKCTRDALAETTGVDASEVSDLNLRNSITSHTRRVYAKELADCRDSSTYKACVQDVSGRMKKRLTDSGIKEKDAKNIVQKLAQQAQNEEVNKAKAVCRSKTGEAQKNQCKQKLRERYAAMTGKDASQISDRVIDKVGKEGAAIAMREILKTCSADEKTSSACKAEVKTAIEEAGVTGTIDDRMMRGWIDRAIDMEAKDYMNNCIETIEADGDAGDCRAEVQELMEEMEGLIAFPEASAREKAVRKGKDKKKMRDIAIEAVKDAQRACREAQADASCKEDAFELFLSMRNVTGELSDKKRKTLKDKLAQEVVVAADKGRKIECLKGETAAIKECLKDLRFDEDQVFDDAFGERGSGFNKEKKKLRLREQSTWEAFDELLLSCVEASSEDDDEEAAKACKTSLKAKFQATMEAEGADGAKLGSFEEVMLRNSARRLAKSLEDCEGELKDCRQDAIDGFLATGGKKHKFAVTFALSLVRQAAELHSQCSEAGNTEEDCNAQAKELFLELSGSSDDSAWDQVSSRVKALATAILSGKPTIIKNLDSIEVKFGYDETLSPQGDCGSDTQKAALLQKVKDAAKAANSTLSNEELNEMVAFRMCSLSFGKAFWSFGTEVHGLADRLESEVEEFEDDMFASLVPPTRRLTESDAEVNLGQESQEVADDSDDSSGSTTMDQGGNTSSAARHGVAFILALALLKTV